jgi:hypothetical protein
MEGKARNDNRKPEAPDFLKEKDKSRDALIRL